MNLPDSMNIINFLGFEIHFSIDDLHYSNQRVIINTINPHSYCLSKTDVQFREALQNSDILIPDGVGIVWACKWLYGKRVKRIPGTDLHEHLLKRLNHDEGKVFFLGAQPATLQKIEARVKLEYPNVKVNSFSPPYKAELSDEDNNEIFSAIKAFNPDVVFIGMTAPKQEKWAHNYGHRLDVRIIATIGAVFDFYSGTVRRPGRIWQSMGLEWFIRLLREPKRLWRRTFISMPCFLWDVIKFKVQMSEKSHNKTHSSAN